jgi:hypothetical protein
MCPVSRGRRRKPRVILASFATQYVVLYGSVVAQPPQAPARAGLAFHLPKVFSSTTPYGTRLCGGKRGSADTGHNRYATADVPANVA